MKRHLLALGALLALIAVAACSGDSSSTVATTVAVTATPTAPAATQVSTQPTTQPTSGTSTLCGSEAAEFVAEGVIGTVGGEGDGDQIVAIRAAEADGCERIVIDFAAGSGAPAARPGAAQAQHVTEAGVIRIILDEAIATTAVADTVFELDIVDRVYVVRSLEGPLFVDIHLVQAATARIATATSPAAILVEMAPTEAELGAAAISNLTVVTSPTTADVSYPLSITGYARTFEATVNAVLTFDDGQTVETFGNAADFLETWGEYRLEFLSGPTGSAELFVGEFSAKDGTPLGVTLEVTLN